jgi:hypothetical protein
MRVPLRIRLALLITLTAIVVPLTAERADAAAAMQIRKVSYDPPGADTRTNSQLNAEYVVLKNTGAVTVDLYQWTLRDRASHVYTFATHKYVSPGATVTIHTGTGTNTTTHRYWGRSWYVWNNTGDTAYLRSRSGNLADSCSWGDGIGYRYC